MAKLDSNYSSNIVLGLSLCDTNIRSLDTCLNNICTKADSCTKAIYRTFETLDHLNQYLCSKSNQGVKARRIQERIIENFQLNKRAQQAYKCFKKEFRSDLIARLKINLKYRNDENRLSVATWVVTLSTTSYEARGLYDVLTYNDLNLWKVQRY